MAVSAVPHPSKQAQASEEGINQEKCINEEYKIWKKNSPFLYDLIITRALEWPCMSLQWYPEQQIFAEHGYTEQKMFLGVRADVGKYLLAVASIQLPYLNQTVPPTAMEGASAGDESSLRVNISNLYSHPESVCSAKLMPQDDSCVATVGNYHNDVLVFDKESFESYSSASESPLKPKYRLTKHTQPCTSVCWNFLSKGTLVSGSQDATLSCWDLNAYNESDSASALKVHISSHEKQVSDVRFHYKHQDLLASVSYDQYLHVHDIRRPDASTKPARSVHAHSGPIHSVAFNPHNDFILATCSTDKTIALWDLRNLNQRLHTLEGHEDIVTKISFSPHEEPILASTSADRRTLVWDLSRIGEDQDRKSVV